MKKSNTTYGVIDIPAGTILCKMENGGDKDGKARYRFADTGKKTSSRLVALVTNETLMPDLYGAQWAHTDKGWVKAEDKITWHGSYREASNALASVTNRKRKVLMTILIIVLAAGIGYLIYKYYKHYKMTTNGTTNDITIEPTIEPTIQTVLPDEIPLD